MRAAEVGSAPASTSRKSSMARPTSTSRTAVLTQSLSSDCRRMTAKTTRGPEQAGQHEPGGRGEEEPEHERGLGQRDGPRAAAHLHMQDAHLGHAEEHREQEPGDAWPERADRSLGQGEGQGEADDGEDPADDPGPARIAGGAPARRRAHRDLDRVLHGAV